MPTTTIRVDSDLLQRVESIKPKYISTTGFFQLLAEQALDTTFTLGKPSPPAPGAPVLPSYGFNKEEERARETFVPKTILKEEINRNPDRKVPGAGDPYRLKTIAADFVPEDLAASADLFCEWWSVRSKGAVRSKKVAVREFEKLRAFKPEDRAAALQKAIAGGWKQLYEPKDLNTFNTATEPVSNHPAHKVFTAAEHYAKPEWNIPSATGGKGVLDGLV